MEVFAAMVEVMDAEIGRIVAKLKAKGQWENTLFLFCADNGACPFERTRGRGLKPWDADSYWTYDASWAHAGNTPFRLYKQNQHEGRHQLADDRALASRLEGRAWQYHASAGASD